MFMNKSVDARQFAMTPRSDVPRSRFDVQHAYKTTFDAGYLIPFFVEEVLPGDTFSLKATIFARLTTPLFPIMDNMHLDTQFFFVPNRLVWTNWVKFMGEQKSPADSISYVIPKIVSPANGYAINSIYDYLGLPTVGQVTATKTVTHSALPLRAINLIYDEWFRDENLQTPAALNVGDGPDAYTDYVLLRRGKRRDYFTSCLPWPQKGTAVSLPLGTSAPVYGDGKALGLWDGTNAFGLVSDGGFNFQAFPGDYNHAVGASVGTGTRPSNKSLGVVTKTGGSPAGSSGLYADMSAVTSATINALRLSVAVQEFLEKDARGGTRYTELLLSHFGVVSPDARLQRPEYLGGGSTPVVTNPIAQTSGTSATGTTTPLGNLGGMSTVLAHGHGFSGSFVEHGHVIGFLSVRADLTYQQGMRRFWSRDTRYDFYDPVFAHLGEQAVLNKEIYCTGDATLDDVVFGYISRWDELRYHPSEITGLFRSTAAGTLDGWHLAQKFTGGAPTLNSTFIMDTPPVDRVLAVGSATGKQFYLDSVITNRMVRPMPMFSVPSLGARL